MPNPAPLVYVNGIACAYHAPEGRYSLEESSGPDGPSYTLYYKTEWSDRWNLVQQLRGTCVADESDQGFTRTAPFQLPQAYQPSGAPPLYCTATGRFLYQGNGWDQTGEHVGRYAIVPATFSCVPWQFQDTDPGGQNDASGEAWTVTKIKPSAEIYQPPGGSYWLGPFPSTTPLDEASIGFPRANVEVSVTRKFLPFLPLADLVEPGEVLPNPAIGSANATNMYFADATFEVAQLLLVGAEASEPYFDCIGNLAGDLTLTYLGRMVGTWNQVQGRDGTWTDINSEKDGSGDPPFALYDFTSLPR